MSKNSFREKRLHAQEIGRQNIKNNDPLYVAGCMLYWGEGSKDKNSVRFTNSDVSMILVFKEFLTKFFGCKKEDFVLTINCYTDCHSIDEIKDYWFSVLDLNSSNLRKSQINNLPKSSKKQKM